VAQLLLKSLGPIVPFSVPYTDVEGEKPLTENLRKPLRAEARVTWPKALGPPNRTGGAQS
jgi:hypothetical protein